MNQRYFKITANDVNDAKQLKTILLTKKFYPETTSTPPLPATVTGGFDYRKLFLVIEIQNDGIIVLTRSEYTVAQFNVNVIPTLDWTTRYNLSLAPTITSLPEYTEYRNGKNTTTSIHAFLNYDYTLTNNK
jgi:hypothetical protein